MSVAQSLSVGSTYGTITDNIQIVKSEKWERLKYAREIKNSAA
jgi:hypothetical protein